MKGKRYTTEEKIRMLRQADKGKTILEACRECRVIHVDRHINAEKVRGVMQKLLDRHGPPKYIRSDNGSDSRSEATTCEAIYWK